MSETAVRHVPDESRYELLLDGRVIGRVTYVRRGSDLILDATEVDDEFSGRGLAGLLATQVFDDLRARGQQVVVGCRYLRRWVGMHPEYADVVAARVSRS